MKLKPLKARLMFILFIILALLFPYPLLLRASKAIGMISEIQDKGGVVAPKPRSTPRKMPTTSKPRQPAPQIDMVLIPAGTFMMGSPDGMGFKSEYPQHRVTMQSFYMGKYEVTQVQYRAVMGTNPSEFKGDNLPVENVSWNDAKAFCRRLSQMTGKEYRLPSEAEWEYACRAGTTGDYAGNLDAMEWYDENSGDKTHPVGQKQPNSFGLYDMRGNVQEWCEDYYHSSYIGAPTDGSAWLSGGSTSRILRGGAWNYPSRSIGMDLANRTGYIPGERDNNLGFRVAAFSWPS